MVIHKSTHIPAWQYHLQLLVLAENRIEYLKQFVERNCLNKSFARYSDTSSL